MRLAYIFALIRLTAAKDEDDPCVQCAAVASCFSAQACSLLDKDTLQWTGEAVACNTKNEEGQGAIDCAFCHSSTCLIPGVNDQDTLCEPCAEAAACFTTVACNFLDKDTLQWSGVYAGCNVKDKNGDGAIDCAVCHSSTCVIPGVNDVVPTESPTKSPTKDTKSPTEAEDQQDLCSQCAMAASCFSAQGCSLLDKDTLQWTGALALCNTKNEEGQGAIDCAPCYSSTCLIPGVNDQATLCEPCAEAAACFTTEACNLLDKDTLQWSGVYANCNIKDKDGDGAIDCAACHSSTCVIPGVNDVVPTESPTKSPTKDTKSATVAAPTSSTLCSSVHSIHTIAVIMVIAYFV